MTIVITGCNGLIGSFITKYLLSKDKKVIGLDVNSKNKVDDKNFNFYEINISEENEVKYFYKNIFEKRLKISSLINAHQYKPKGFLANEVNSDFALWQEVIKANLNGLYLMCLGLKEYKGIKNDDISIINFGSTYGRVSSNPYLYENNDMGNPACYSASKGGVHMLTKYIAANWISEGIRANTIVPHGVFNNHQDEFIRRFSELTPIKRMMHVEEIIPSIDLLLDKRNTYMNGSEIVIDGGWSIW